LPAEKTLNEILFLPAVKEILLAKQGFVGGQKLTLGKSHLC
jgi:hypothetical protein